KELYKGRSRDLIQTAHIRADTSQPGIATSDLIPVRIWTDRDTDGMGVARPRQETVVGAVDAVQDAAVLIESGRHLEVNTIEVTRLASTRPVRDRGVCDELKPSSAKLFIHVQGVRSELVTGSV